MLLGHSFARYSLFIAPLLSGFWLHAQDLEIVNVQSAFYPKQSFEESSIDGKIGFFEWGAQVAVPQIFKKHNKTILIHKIGYANLSANSRVSLPLVNSESIRYFHTITYDLGFIQSVGTNWRLVANFIPTIASDFGEKFSLDDMLFQANGLVINNKREKLKYGFGLAYTTRLGRQLLIPMGLLTYTARRFKLNIVLPSKLSAMIETNKNIFSFGVKAGLNGGVFNNSSELPTVSYKVDEVGYSRLILGPAFSIRLKDAININLDGGVTINRRLEFIDSNNVIIDRTPKATPFLGFGISFAPVIKQSNANLSL